MRTLLSAIIVMGSILVGCSPVGKGPLSFQSPTDWKVDHKKSGGLHFYTLTARSPVGSHLEFSQWPVPGTKPEEIPTLVKEVVGIFLREAKTSTEFTLASEEYCIEQFADVQCQGSYATFQMGGDNTNILQVIFMISVDSKIWNGQFTGPSNAWKQAFTVLKTAKQDG